MLECCGAINTNSGAFQNAFRIFNEGGSANAVRTALSTRAPNFVKALKELFGDEFAVPAPPKQSVLQKRGQVEPVAAHASPPKQQKTAGIVQAKPAE